jgi:hypothetical protein
VVIRRESRLVCENHPDKAWPDECECGAGMPDPFTDDDDE